MMGGIHTDKDAATPLAGLYAAGECACVSINGANRLGSNSLTELLVFGRRAALSALRYIRGGVRPASDAALAARAEDSQARVRALFQRTGCAESVAGLRREMADAMEEHLGIYRDEAGMSAACDKLAELLSRYTGIELHDKTNVYNTDLLQALELGSMLECAEAVAQGALLRRESRGAHQRLDFPERDDRNFLRHTLAHHRAALPPRIDYLDVVITRSRPGVRDYSGARK
jgi:fumarate reductase flavoprotein subunit